jgi:Flp pilus assembly protein CpaB
MMQSSSVGRGTQTMPQRRVLLLAAVVCAGVALVATLWVTRRGQGPSAPPAGQEQVVKKVPVIVAVRDLPKGARVSSADVRVVDLPEDKVPKDAVTNLEGGIKFHLAARSAQRTHHYASRNSCHHLSNSGSLACLSV